MSLLARLSPDGLGARLAWLLAIALIAANAVALFVLSLERDRLVREREVERAIAQVVAAVPLLERVGAAERERLLRRADDAIENASIGGRPRVRAPFVAPRLRGIADRINAELGGEREVRLALRAPSRRRGPERGRGGGEKARLHLSVELLGAARGEWLNASIVAGSSGQARGGPASLVLIVGLSLAFVLLVALWYVRRLTRPLGDLAAAATAAGRGDRSARVAETGARELREVAHAFNTMQARIAQFEAERTRTLAAVGHDLRTPITSLRIRAEMLEDEAREPMVRTLDEMRVMADGLVTYARGDGEAEEPRTVDLAALVRRIAEERGATLGVVEAAWVRARPVALARAIGNLVDNALRYAGAAEVSLTVEADESVIRIEDRGPGIAEERLNGVMEPFVRGEASRSLETGGAGLGLSIARGVVQSHGGTLTLRNRRGGGLSAEVRLAAAAAPSLNGASSRQ